MLVETGQEKSGRGETSAGTGVARGLLFAFVMAGTFGSVFAYLNPDRLPTLRGYSVPLIAGGGALGLLTGWFWLSFRQGDVLGREAFRRFRWHGGAILLAGIGMAAWGGWDRLFPVPVAVVGTWESETDPFPFKSVGDTQSRAIRWEIGADGTVVSTCVDRRTSLPVDNKSFNSEFKIRIKGERIILIHREDPGPPPEVKFEFSGNQFRVSDPFDPRPEKGLVFRRVRNPEESR